MVFREQLDALRDVLGEQGADAMIPVITRDPDSFLLRDCSLEDAPEVVWQVIGRMGGGAVFVAAPTDRACDYVIRAIEGRVPSCRVHNSLRFLGGTTVYWATYGRVGCSRGLNFDALVVVR
jgi:hypothetical protein